MNGAAKRRCLVAGDGAVVEREFAVHDEARATDRDGVKLTVAASDRQPVDGHAGVGIDLDHIIRVRLSRRQ